MAFFAFKQEMKQPSMNSFIDQFFQHIQMLSRYTYSFFSPAFFRS